MFELTEANPPVNVLESEYQRLLGYPKDHTLEGRARELADAACHWFSEHGRPWIYARELDTMELREGKLHLAGHPFTSRRLHDILAAAKAHSAALVAVSAGAECVEEAQRLWQESKPDEYFFMEVYGSAVVEQLVTVASGRICGWADQQKMAVLPHYSPGFTGWDIAEQIPLWNLIQPGQGRRFPGELSVMESGMLRPKKSQLAVFGLTRDLEKARGLTKLVPCANCSLPGCEYRRTIYRHAPPRLEDLPRRLHSSPATI
jgi:hypothetical protein